MIHNVQIRMRPLRTELVVDGHHLEHGTRRLTIEAGAHEIPTVTVELDTHEVVIDGEAQLLMPEQTRETLVRLGWTPPESDRA